jgi:hypothetical protein
VAETFKEANVNSKEETTQPTTKMSKKKTAKD